MAQKRLLSNYSGTQEVLQDVLCPSDEEELREIFAQAARDGRRLVFRSGGQSFDVQAMGSDRVVSLERFRGFELDEGKLRLTVGTGLAWGEILARLAPRGLVPGVVVSSSRATPGGTLSNHAHQRFSPRMGKEGDWIESVRMVIPSGEALDCDRRRNSELFYAAIGGLGWIGAVISVTYRLLRPGEASWVETVTEVVEGAEKIAAGLLPEGTGEEWPGSYGPVVFQGGRLRAVLCRSRYPLPGSIRPKKRMILFQPWSWSRIPFDAAAASAPWVTRLMWWLAFGFYYRIHSRFGDPLRDYTFFMDGHGETKKFLRRFGFRMRAVQQAYLVPVREFERFLRQAREIWERAGEAPTMVDVIYLPKDREPFLLSPTCGMDGFLFTVTYESLASKRLRKSGEILRKLSTLCARLGGRVQLTKNVFCDPENLESMYGARLDEFFAVKRRADPGFLLRNEFLERTFPGRLGGGVRIRETGLRKRPPIPEPASSPAQNG